MIHKEYGEQRGIGASAKKWILGGKTIIGDWGGGFEGFGNEKRDLEPAGDYLRGEKIDLILISHFHLDHTGRLLRLLKYHPETMCYMSRETYQITCILLEDAMKVGMRQLNAALRASEFPLPAPSVTEQELKDFFAGKQIHLIDGNTWLDEEDLPEGFKDWQIGVHDTGHVFGAKMFLIDPPNDRRMLWTGDTSSHDQTLVPGVMLPDRDFSGSFFDAPDLVMVTECTNGSRDLLRPRSEEKEEFVARVKEIQARGGFTLIYTFGAARSPEGAAMLAEAGIVPWIDGMARRTIEIEAPHLVKSGKVRLVPNDPKNAKVGWEAREEILATPGSVMIAPSGSLEGGYSVFYAKRIFPGRGNGAFSLGHIFENSSAEQLKNVAKNVERGRTISLPDFEKGRVPVDVRCDSYHFDFSSHDYRSALAERVRLVKPETLIGHHSGASEGVDGFDGLCANVQGLMGASSPTMLRGEHLREINLLPKGRR